MIAWSDQSPWLNALLFALAAATIGWGGARLEGNDVIARRTGMGQAFSGMVLLATATSLPELVATITAVVVLDNATLAIRRRGAPGARHVLTRGRDHRQRCSQAPLYGGDLQRVRQQLTRRAWPCCTG